MGELSDYVLKNALENGICDEWAQKIAECDDLDLLLAMYVKGIDFCLNNNFPTNDDLLRLAGEDKLKEHGIYVDCDCSLNNRPFAVALGSSDISNFLDGFAVSEIFVKGKSKVNVAAHDNSLVVIDCFDDTKVNVIASGNAKVLINVYDQARAEFQKIDNSTVKVVKKNKKGY